MEGNPLPTGWAQQRQQARALETQTEKLFSSYSQYLSVPNLETSPSDEEKRLTVRIDELLTQRENIISSLQRLLDSEPTPSAIKQTNLVRHREILAEHTRELSRLRSSISEARDRANLLQNVQSDISAYRNANPEAEYMLEERNRIENSHSMADNVLAQAYSIQETFGLQRETLISIQRKIQTAAEKVPGMNQLISRIGSRKRRDGIIMGGFVAFCFLILLFFR